jgi:hypothetical protein
MTLEQAVAGALEGTPDDYAVALAGPPVNQG